MTEEIQYREVCAFVDTFVNHLDKLSFGTYLSDNSKYTIRLDEKHDSISSVSHTTGIVVCNHEIRKVSKSLAYFLIMWSFVKGNGKMTDLEADTYATMFWASRKLSKKELYSDFITFLSTRNPSEASKQRIKNMFNILLNIQDDEKVSKRRRFLLLFKR